MGTSRRRKRVQPNPYDCMIYWSKQDECWVAHSLRTDQIGLGQGPVYALADMIKAVDQVMDVAAEDASITPWREAPARVQNMVEKADVLPREMYEVAHRMALGEWPKHLDIVDVKPPTRRRFTVEEPAPA